jgi:hypothetical protein
MATCADEERDKDFAAKIVTRMGGDAVATPSRWRLVL